MTSLRNNTIFSTLLITISLTACFPGSGSSRDPEPQVQSPSQRPADSDSYTSEGCVTDVDAELPDWIRLNFVCVEAWQDGSYYVFRTDDIPDHKSYYFGSGDSRFEALPSGQIPNPNFIQSQDFEFRIPVNPVANASLTESNLGPIGLAINGVAIFNNQARPGDDLSTEMQTFDAASGHPTPNGIYHYHTEPLKLTNNDSRLIGVLRDGFPVYGKLDEDGSVPADLDATNGHTHPTSHFPEGRYHYHVTDTDPYISSAYRGTPGGLSQ